MVENFSLTQRPNDHIKTLEIEKYYRNIQEQLLNIVINNFDVPLAIFVNIKDNTGDIDVDEKPGDEKPLDIVLDKDWFENNVNSKLETPKENYYVFNGKLNL